MLKFYKLHNFGKRDLITDFERRIIVKKVPKITIRLK